MDVKEIKSLKDALQKKICEDIFEFENKTESTVQSIELSSLEVDGQKMCIAVRIFISL